MASITSSIARHTPDLATPRYGRIGHLLVAIRGAATISLQMVRSRQQAWDHPRFQGCRSWIDRIGASVDVGFAIDTKQAAFRIGIRGDQVIVLAAVGICRELFPAILKPAQRMTELQSKPAKRDLLAAQNALVTEAATDVW